jgi:ribosomal protein S18 acetylase RimI-like enzyme
LSPAIDPPQIRAARAADLPALLELETLFPSDRLSRRSLRRFIGLPNAWFGVAEHGELTLGNLLLLTRRGSHTSRIYSMIVSPQARGLGVAKRLVAAAQRWAVAQGCDTISLEVRADNAAAIGLYQGLGFAIERRLPAYYDDGADGLRMRKSLVA